MVIAGFLLAAPARAQRVVCSKAMNARTCDLLADPVERQLKQLAASADWQWVILSEKDWGRATRMFRNADKTTIAFTVLKLRITFLNEEFLQRNRPWPVLDVLAHELGHIRCTCGSEHEAERIGNQLLTAHNVAPKDRPALP